MIICSIPWCRAGRAQGAQILYLFFDALGGDIAFLSITKHNANMSQHGNVVSFYIIDFCCMLTTRPTI